MSIKLPIVALISGNGSNLQAIIDAGPPAQIHAVISNREGAYGLERARRAGIPALHLDPQHYPDRAAYDSMLMERIDGFDPGLVVLAGFMRILSAEFVRRYEGRLINIHPSLLPAFRGLNTHERALQAGIHEHGASVHFVTEELDAGPVIIQQKVPVLPSDDPQTLAARVLKLEHRIYPKAIEWFALGKIRMRAGEVLMEGKPLLNPLDMDTPAQGQAR